MHTNTLDFEAIGRRIRTLRTNLNLTQEYLAQKANVNVSHISNIENNKVKISLSTLVAVANALDVTVDYILENEYVVHTGIDSQIIKKLCSCDTQKKEKLLKIMELL